MIIIKPYKNRLLPHNKHKELELLVKSQVMNLLGIEKIIDRYNLKYAQLSIRHTDNEDFNEVSIRFNKSIPNAILLSIIEELYKMEGITDAKMKSS